jgi:uncharacterized protein (DUF2249 family)
MIEVWHRGRAVKITVGDQTIIIDQDDVLPLLQELDSNRQGQWNRAEIEQLVTLQREGKKPAQIARIIGRERVSVNAKLFKLRQDGAL